MRRQEKPISANQPCSATHPAVLEPASRAPQRPASCSPPPGNSNTAPHTDHAHHSRHAAPNSHTPPTTCSQHEQTRALTTPISRTHNASPPPSTPDQCSSAQPIPRRSSHGPAGQHNRPRNPTDLRLTPDTPQLDSPRWRLGPTLTEPLLTSHPFTPATPLPPHPLRAPALCSAPPRRRTAPGARLEREPRHSSLSCQTRA